jgi:DNA recombination protein RmuC
MGTALSTEAGLLAMLPSVALLIAFIAVAAGCFYISHRVGQVVSPTSRKLEQRFAELEAAFSRSEKDLRQSLERHREANAKEAGRLLEDGTRAAQEQAHSVRRGLDDFGQRINTLRLDLERDSQRVREDVESALAAVREGQRDSSADLARMQGEALASLSGQIGSLASDSERRQERAMASLEGMGSDLKTAYAASATELRERMTADLGEVRAAAAQLAEAVAGQGTRLHGVEETIRGALQESAAKQGAVNAAVESHVARFRDEASGQLAQVLAADERLEASWGRLKGDFDAITKSLLQIGRAVDKLKNELTVKLGDGAAPVRVDSLLERVLQPNEFERDVEIEPGTNRRVAFAVRLSDNPMTRVWLPIGTLPVVAGYNEFVAATVYSDDDAIKSSSQTFERAILAAAEELSVKFVCPPRTLNLAVLLAPTDDLFAEIARRDSLVDAVRRNFNIMIAGPATLPTLLTGLRMAFKGTSTVPARMANGPERASLAPDGD